MRDCYKSAENENFKLSIIVDDTGSSPRDWDNLGSMVCWHSRYSLGDKHQWSEVDAFLENLVYDVMPPEFDTAEEYIAELCKDIEDKDYRRTYIDRVLTFLEKHYIILPLYLYDHSGITISTSPFSCKWDSGQVGWIYVSHKDIEKEYGKLDIETISKANLLLESEVEVYDQYLTGDVYGFILENKVKCECCNHTELEHEDSCWGFYGTNWKENGVLDHVGKEHEDLVNKL